MGNFFFMSPTRHAPGPASDSSGNSRECRNGTKAMETETRQDLVIHGELQPVRHAALFFPKPSRRAVASGTVQNEASIASLSD